MVFLREHVNTWFEDKGVKVINKISMTWSYASYLGDSAQPVDYEDDQKHQST